MQFKIFKDKNLIQGISDVSSGGMENKKGTIDCVPILFYDPKRRVVAALKNIFLPENKKNPPGFMKKNRLDSPASLVCKPEQFSLMNKFDGRPSFLFANLLISKI